MWSKIEETSPNELYDQADLLTKKQKQKTLDFLF